MRYYAGIGSRQAPTKQGPDSLYNDIYLVTSYMYKNGFVLRSGGAPGADTLFEKLNNMENNNFPNEIYLPWKGFNGNTSPLYNLTPEAFELAEKYHPAWDRLSDAAKKLMARNSYQVLGENLNTPVELIICWTPEGKESGGTSQAMRIAKDYDIPIVNLFNKEKAFREITKIVTKQTLF